MNESFNASLETFYASVARNAWVDALICFLPQKKEGLIF